MRAEQPAYPDADAGGRGVRGEGEFPTGALPSSNPARWIASASRAYYTVVSGTTTVKAVTRRPWPEPKGRPAAVGSLWDFRLHQRT